MAKWFCFNRDWDDRPHPRQMHAYKEGSTVFLPEGVIERAEAAGAGTQVKKPAGLGTTKSGKTVQRDVEFKG